MRHTSQTAAPELRPTPARAQVDGAAGEAPLCVDLDGTLVATDTLWEASLALVRKGLQWLWIPFWLLRGKAYLKQRIAALSPLDPSTLPYQQELLHELQLRHAEGRTIVLCTGADESTARRVSEHLGIFDEIFASDGKVNLTGSRKLAALEARFGKGNFDYAGNGWSDLAVWQGARAAHVVNPSHGLLRTMERRKIAIASVLRRPPSRSRLSLWLRAVRIHQWAKNLLLYVPLALSHRPALLEASLGFLAFGLAASSAYLLNDLMDLQADRRHAHKKRRPFASGELPVQAALAAVPLLWIAAAGISLLLPARFGLTLAAYLIGTLAYSFWLKQRAMVDVIVLAGLYTVRIEAGGAAAQIPISPWTLALAVFLFLSLAMVKRVSELREARQAETVSVPGRDYMRADLPQLSSMGIAAGYLTVLVMALYIHSPEVQELYSRPQWLWFILPIQLYWIGRIWLYTNRGWINQDPLIFALKDRTSYIAGILAAAIAVLAV